MTCAVIAIASIDDADNCVTSGCSLDAQRCEPVRFEVVWGSAEQQTGPDEAPIEVSETLLSLNWQNEPKLAKFGVPVRPTTIMVSRIAFLARCAYSVGGVAETATRGAPAD
jgi:hypothetical protein